MITAERIGRFSPRAKPDLVQALVDGWPMIRDAGINTPLRVAHFIAQIATETGGFTIYEENLNYGAKRLMEVWPARFPDLQIAGAYAHNPEKLANFVYADANRKPGYRLGNTKPGDGWRYRGRGFIQTTGRDNYRKAGFEDAPEKLSVPSIGLRAAVDEFVSTGCLKLADKDNITTIRKRINGGDIGLDRARVYLAKARLIFTPLAEPAPFPPPPDIEPISTTPADPAAGAVVGWVSGVIVMALAAWALFAGVLQRIWVWLF
jgi:putative chitinase